MSIAGVLAYRPDRSRSAFVFSITDGADNTDKLIEFLTELRSHFAGEQIIVIWDGLMAHRSRAMTAWLATQRDWLHVKRLPAYAPELNPIEQVWGNVKSTELANLCPDILDEVRVATETGLTGSAPTTACATASSTTPGFHYDHHSLNYRNIFKRLGLPA